MKEFILITAILLGSFFTDAQINSEKINLVLAPNSFMQNNAASISPDVKYAVQAGAGPVLLWDVKTGRLIKSISMASGLPIITHIWFSDDSKTIYAYNKYDLPKKRYFKIDLTKKDYQMELSVKPKKGFTDNIVMIDWLNSHDKKNKYIKNSPDNKKQIIFMPDIESSVDGSELGSKIICINNKDSIELGVEMGMDVYFNKNSTLVLANNRIIDLEKNRIISKFETQKIPQTGICFKNENQQIFATINGVIVTNKTESKFIKVQGLIKVVSTNIEDEIYCIVKENGASKVKVINLESEDFTSFSFKNKMGFFMSWLSPDKNNIMLKTNVSYGYAPFQIFNLKTGKLLLEHKSNTKFRFGPNDKLIASSRKEIYAPLHFYEYDLSVENLEKKEFTTLNNSNDFSKYRSFDISKNGQYMMCVLDNIYQINKNEVKHKGIIVNLETNKIVTELLDDDFNCSYFDASPDNKFASYYNYNTSSIRIISMIDGRLVGEIFRYELLNSDLGISPYFSSDSKTLIIQDKNGRNIFWDVINKKEKYTVTYFSKDERIITIPSGYYISTKKGIDKMHFVVNNKVFPFEQFDLKYNRPDIVLKKLGYANENLIKTYKNAYLKRLKKMGFTENMIKDDFHIPELKIENLNEIPSFNETGSINLKLNLIDSKYNLDRINVWINDVAIYGNAGISLREKMIQEYSTSLKVNLANGKSKIQVSVLNQAGAESYKETFHIESTAGKVKPDLYLITIGESEFKQSIYNLTYAAKDANDIAQLLSKSNAYDHVFTKTLVNEQVIKENVIALKSFFSKADINDQVMIFIAGHGVLDANYDYYFATYDMDFANPKEEGLAYEDLESLLDGIKPLKKTLLIDACHSGEIDKDEIELASSDNIEKENIRFRAVGNSVQHKLGMQNTSELTKSLFMDLRKGTGATVISSAGGMEFAMEGADWKNGLYTYCLLNGIESKKADINNDGEIWLSELQKYVTEQVTELSDGKQQPTSRIVNQAIDFRVW